MKMVEVQITHLIDMEDYQEDEHGQPYDEDHIRAVAEERFWDSVRNGDFAYMIEEYGSITFTEVK